MADVVGGAPFGQAGSHREDRGGAVQGLDLALFIDAQDQRPLGWVEVETDDVADLVHKERVGRQFEHLGPVWLQAKGPPDPTNRGLA
jgi:hypothetical protein